MRKQYVSEAFDELKANDKKMLLLDYPVALLQDISDESADKSTSSTTSVKSICPFYSYLISIRISRCMFLLKIKLVKNATN